MTDPSGPDQPHEADRPEVLSGELEYIRQERRSSLRRVLMSLAIVAVCAVAGYFIINYMEQAKQVEVREVVVREPLPVGSFFHREPGCLGFTIVGSLALVRVDPGLGEALTRDHRYLVDRRNHGYRFFTVERVESDDVLLKAERSWLAAPAAGYQPVALRGLDPRRLGKGGAGDYGPLLDGGAKIALQAVVQGEGIELRAGAGDRWVRLAGLEKLGAEDRIALRLSVDKAAAVTLYGAVAGPATPAEARQGILFTLDVAAVRFEL